MNNNIKIITLLLSVLISLPAIAKNTYVQPYIKSNGTYVNGYYKTTPNNNIYDNWSTKGNYNPYTGQKGTQDPYKYKPGHKIKSYNNYNFDNDN